MKKLAKITAFVLCIAMALSFAACSSEKIVAKVNGTNISYADYETLLKQYCNMYYMTPEDLDSYVGVEYANSFRDEIVDELIREELILQKAKELGLNTLTDEEKKNVQSTTEGFFNDAKESLREEIEYENEIAEEADVITDIDAEVEKRFKEKITDQGLTQNYVYSYYEKTAIFNKVFEELTKDVSVTDEEISNYYSENLLAQKSVSIDSAISAYLNKTNDVTLYVPSGIRYVKHILIKIPDDALTEIYGIEDEAQKKTRLQKELAKLEPKAKEALAKVQAGEDFDALIAEYGEDEGMTEEPVKTQGYAVYANSNLVDEFETAALALENVGDVTGLVASNYGYHIIKYISAVEAKEVSLEEAKEEIQNVLKVEKQQEKWYELLDEWVSAAEIEYVTENYYSVEPSAAPEATDNGEGAATATPTPTDEVEPEPSADATQPAQ